MGLYKGYIETNGKKSIEKLKDRTKWKTYDQVKDCKSFGGVLDSDTILIDVDDKEQSEIMMRIVEDKQLNCKVIQTTRGRHFLFKNHYNLKNSNDTKLACGLTADIKCGSKTSYEVLKVDGVERFVEWDIEPGEQYQEIPKWFLPVRCSVDFLELGEGDGRNQSMYNYILTLTAHGLTTEEIRDTIRLMNAYVLKVPLSDEELETILRDESFEKPVFFLGNTFLFDRFATWMKNNKHVVRINGQLHIYKDGIYVSGLFEIEREISRIIPTLSDAKRKEAIKYINLIADDVKMADAKYIAFKNGLYDISAHAFREFSPDITVTNKIPWEYREDAYDELTDKTLNKLAVDDEQIRALLEECIGYCMYRRNEIGKAFILTGDKSNGKSTYLKMIKEMLGEDNISALDLKELGDRFSTAMMFAKLANIGDDIGDDFLMGSQVSTFKKIVTGERLKAERKGENPFEFNPYIKLLFSANDIPRMRDKTGAVLRRLIIIPFNAVFSREDPDFDSHIIDKLTSEEAMEYLVRLGIEGLSRVISADGFTKSDKVEAEIQNYEEENNPIIAFIADQGIGMILNEPTADVYKRYQIFCVDNAMQPMSNIVFSKQINKRLGSVVKASKINGKVIKMFVKE